MSVVKKTATGKRFLEKVNTGADTGVVSGGKFVDGTAPADAVFTGGNVGIGIQPTEKLSVQGVIESKTGGIKFPDATVQTSAAAGGGKFVDGSTPADAVFTGGNVGIGEQPTEKLSVAGIVKSSTGGFKFPDDTVQTSAAAGSVTVDAKIINYQDRSKNRKTIQVLTEQWQDPIIQIPGFAMTSSPPGFNKPQKLRWSPDGKFLTIARNVFGVGNSLEILYEDKEGSIIPIPTQAMGVEVSSATTEGASWSPNSQYLAIGDDTSPDKLKILKRSGLFFERITGPVFLPSDRVVDIAWSSKNYLAVGFVANPYLIIYKVEGETFTTISTPTTAVLAQHNTSLWSPSGEYLVFGQNNTTSGVGFEIYKLNSNGTITLLPSPIINPLGGVRAVAWSRDNQFLAIGRDTSAPYLVIYQRSGDTFTQITSINYTPNNPVKGVGFHPDGKNFVIYEEDRVAGSLVSFIQSGSTFTQTTDLPDNPTDTNLGFSDVVFSPDGRYLAQSGQAENGVKLRTTSYILPVDPHVKIKEIIDVGTVDSRESLFLGRMTTVQRDNFISPVLDGSILYNTTTNLFNFRQNGAWVSGAGLL